MTTVEARLLGGPFCGDSGLIIVPLPEHLWVFACGSGRRCRVGGVHWARETDTSPPDAVIYDRGPVDDSVQLYIYEDLRLESGDSARDETRAPRELTPV